MGELDRYVGATTPLPRKQSRAVSRELAQATARDVVDAAVQQVEQNRRLRDQQHIAQRTAAANQLIREVVDHSRDVAEDDPLVAGYVARALDRGVGKIIDQI